VHLEPLAIAANVAQASHTRLDHVLLMLGNLFRIYSDPSVEEHVQQSLHASLEKRWKAADQPVFILAIFFNPYIRSSCFNQSYLPRNLLYQMSRRMFERIYGREANLDFWQAYIDYDQSAGMFSESVMMLKESKEVHEREVSWDLIGRSGNCPNISYDSYEGPGHRSC
jgi:hypothetical protein